MVVVVEAATVVALAVVVVALYRRSSSSSSRIGVYARSGKGLFHTIREVLASPMLQRAPTIIFGCFGLLCTMSFLFGFLSGPLATSPEALQLLGRMRMATVEQEP